MPPELHEQAEAKFRLLHELVEVGYISCETMRSSRCEASFCAWQLRTCFSSKDDQSGNNLGSRARGIWHATCRLLSLPAFLAQSK
jgi:hypothetical protein